jgi:hypothetical protein
MMAAAEYKAFRVVAEP